MTKSMKQFPGYTIRFPQTGGAPGIYGSIAFTAKDWKAFENTVQPKGRSQIEVVMKTWCKVGPKDLPRKKFRFETHIKKGGDSVRVEAFKGWQTRYYGVAIDVGGKIVFLVTASDLSKKRDSANRELLKTAGHKAIDLMNELPKGK